MSKGKGSNIRQIILVVVMLLFLGGFLLDKFVLWPAHMEKINKVVNEVTLKLSDENRQQVRDIIGREPNSTFTHNGIEVQQYRFSRGIPGFKRPMLDIAFEGDTIAFFRQDEPIDTAYIDQQLGPVSIVAQTGDAPHPGTPELLGSNGRRPPSGGDDNDEPDSEEASGDEPAGDDEQSEDSVDESEQDSDSGN